MKVGIYAKHLGTLGGGEKVATSMAEILSKRGHNVDLISTFPVEINEIESKMGVDLSKVNHIAWLERSYKRLAKRTQKYDLFINVSFLDHQYSRAKNSIYYILFPSPVKTTFLGFIKYAKLLPFLRGHLLIPEVSSGLEYIEEVNSRGAKWLRDKNFIVFSNTPREFTIKFRIYTNKMDVFSLSNFAFSSHNCIVEVMDKRIEHTNNILTYTLRVKQKRDESPVVFISTRDTAKNPVALVSMTVNNYRFFLWNYIKRYLSQYEMALYGSSTFKLAGGIETYDLLLADSKYSQKWTHNYWKKDSIVLYPPIDIREFRPGVKKNIILSVGRFFVGGHSKRQDILIKAFKSMVVGKTIDDTWELHLAGGIEGGWDHFEYFRTLQEDAKSYPIFFHTSISFSELKKLYSKAKIYWHATGYDVSERANPIELEHFGITPIEAMAAGVVPVVYHGGGLIESVDEGSGFTWKTIPELKSKTLLIANSEKLRKRFSKNSQISSKRFSTEVFEEQFLKIVNELLK